MQIDDYWFVDEPYEPCEPYEEWFVNEDDQEPVVF